MKLVDVDKLEKAMTIAAANDRDTARRTWSKAICVLHDAEIIEMSGETNIRKTVQKVKDSYIKQYPHLRGIYNNDKIFFDNACRLAFPLGITPLELDRAMTEVYNKEKKKEKVWYTEQWDEIDLQDALLEAGISVTEKNIEKMKEASMHLFDDKSARNEMLVNKAREIFEEE